jgi:hypothetical protein
MNSLFKLIAVASLFLSSFLSCKKQEQNYDLHYGYFGFTPGRFVDYNVIEITHDENLLKAHDTLRYQLRTVIGDTFKDNAGRIAREFIRYKRKNATQQWEETDIWTAIIADARAEIVEENQRFIKLVFEPNSSKRWNPNAYTTYPPMEAKYKWVHKPFKYNAFNFDSTLRVNQDSLRVLYFYRRKFEVYAKNIGLIQKYYKDLDIEGFDTLNVKFGKELYYTCIGYGFK